jgi:hypothetical protein
LKSSFIIDAGEAIDGSQPNLAITLQRAFTMNWIRDARRAKIRDQGEEAMRREIFSSGSRACDFSTALHALVSIIFLLTSFPVDSIHQSVATKHRC